MNQKTPATRRETFNVGEGYRARVLFIPDGRMVRVWHGASSCLDNWDVISDRRYPPDEAEAVYATLVGQYTHAPKTAEEQ